MYTHTLTIYSWKDVVTSGTFFRTKLAGALSFTGSLLAMRYGGTISTLWSFRNDLEKHTYINKSTVYDTAINGALKWSISKIFYNCYNNISFYSN